MERVRAGVLDIAYREFGPPDGPPAVLLHGFPYDIQACEAAALRLAADGVRCLVPYLRGYGPTRFLDPATPRSGRPAAGRGDQRAVHDRRGLGGARRAGKRESGGKENGGPE
jgi:pimeloyl-ACP methyl ester carboxylesterase